MPSPVAGSRLPVGSSASRISGRLTNARGDRDALLLATAELVRESLLLAGQADEIEHRRHLLADDVLRSADHLEGEGDVLVHGAVGQQLVVLEDVADVAAQVGHLAVGHLVDVPPGDPHRALLGALLAVHHPQQRALAGARRAHEEDELRLGDVEAGVTERDDLGRVALGDILESDHRGFSTNCCCARHPARSSGNTNPLTALPAVATAGSPP